MIWVIDDDASIRFVFDKALDVNSINHRLFENAEAALETMKLNHMVSPLENPSQIKAARRDIARMKTEIRLRELNK